MKTSALTSAHLPMAPEKEKENDSICIYVYIKDLTLDMLKYC